MLVDKNEVIPSVIFPWNEICSSDILLKYAFSTKSLDEYCKRTLKEHRLCTFDALVIERKLLGYVINKILRFF